MLERDTPNSRPMSVIDVRVTPCRAKQRAAASSAALDSGGGGGGRPRTSCGRSSALAMTPPVTARGTDRRICLTVPPCRSDQADASVDGERRTGDVLVAHQEEDRVGDLLGAAHPTKWDALGHRLDRGVPVAGSEPVEQR